MNSNTNYEISSDCFLPLESTDSITTQSIDTGGVTIVHNHNSSSATIPTHCEDTQFWWAIKWYVELNLPYHSLIECWSVVEVDPNELNSLI